MAGDKNILDAINELINSDATLSGLFGGSVSPAYTYYEDGKHNRYFCTVKKIEHKGNMRYVAGIYRYVKSKDHWKLTKKVGFAKKKLALDWAYRHYAIAEGLSDTQHRMINLKERWHRIYINRARAMFNSAGNVD